MRILSAAVGAFVVAFLPFTAPALTIVPTYDSSITSLANAAQIEGAFSNAAAAFENHFTNVAVINLNVFFTNNISLGASITKFIGNPTYAQLTNALHNARVSAADSNSVASLPASNPIASTNVWWVSRAEAKMLYPYGLTLVTTNNSGLDGSIFFASTVSYTFDATNRAVSGKFDFIGVAQHEISEVLGRSYALGTLGPNGDELFDLFRFTSPGVRNLIVTNVPVYFSVDNGTTALRSFYTNAALGDVQDWLTTTISDSYDAFVSSGQANWLSPVDITALDVLGYNTPGLSTNKTIATTRVTNGITRLDFTNLYSMRFTVLESTNLLTPTTNWTALGVATEISSGHYQYTDTQATNTQRFYRLRSP